MSTSVSGGSPLPFGALHFASPQTFAHNTGDRSAMLAIDDAPPERLAEGIVELPNGIWWSNLDYKDMQRANLVGRPDIKLAGYLPTRPRSVIAEFGMVDAPFEDQVSLCSRVFTRVMQRAHTLFGLPRAPAGGSLPEALRNHFFVEDSGATAQMDPAVQYAIDAACQPVTQSGATEFFDDARLAVMRHHRQRYAAEILSTPVPFGEWRTVVPPDGPEQQLEWVRTNAELMPLLMRVRVQFTGPDRHEHVMLAGFGSGRRRLVSEDGTEEASARQWIATPEYLALAPFAEITIMDAFASDGFQPNRWHMIDRVDDGPEGKTSVQMGPIRLSGRSALSYSDGLLAEALWFGATRSRGVHRTTDAMWLQSVDRSYGLSSAFEIQAHRFVGVQVAGFSRGRIWLRINAEVIQTTEDQALMLSELSVMTGLVPPALPEVQHFSSGRYRMATMMRERSHDRNQPESAGCFAAAMNIIGNRAILAEAI